MISRSCSPMDDIDRRLLTLLEENANRSIKELAASVELSQSSVRDRIARLKASGVIRRYTVEIARASSTITAVLMVRHMRTPAPRVVQMIVEYPEVVRCRSLSGEIDLLVELSAQGMAEINRVHDRIAADPGVADVVTSFVLNEDKAQVGSG